MSKNQANPRGLIGHDDHFWWVPTEAGRRLDWCNTLLGTDFENAVKQADRLNAIVESEESGTVQSTE
jgi:hypothetical protein